MDGFLYTEKEIASHAEWILLFGPIVDAVEALPMDTPKVLDVGCGSGAFGKMLESRKVPSFYIGVDLSWDNIVAGRTSYGLSTLFQGNACQLPFADNAFDVVISVGVIQSLPDLTSALAEMLRVGSGRVVVEVVEAPVGVNSFYESGLDGLDSLVALYNHDQLMELLISQGLPKPDRVLARSAQSNQSLAKPFYRNVPYRVRSLFYWGL